MIYIKAVSGNILEMRSVIVANATVPDINGNWEKISVVTNDDPYGVNHLIIADVKSRKDGYAVIDWLWQQISVYNQQFVDINDCPGLND